MTVSFAAPGAAFANAANPAPGTTATSTIHGNGSVTINLSGSWTWPGQDCAGRYGEGWAVDWWGVSSSPTAAAFSVSNASLLEPSGAGYALTTGSESSTGSLAIPGTANYFHFGPYYNGEDVNSAATCTDTGAGKSATSSGAWNATATYPSASDVPPQLCVIMYDEHGTEGSPTNKVNDFTTTDHDNSIQTNAFNPAQGGGYCFSSNFTPAVSVKKTGPATGTAGGTGTYTLTVSNSGPVAASNVTVTDTLPAGESYVSSVDTHTASGTCAGSAASSTVTCQVDTVPANSSTTTITVTVSYANNASGTLTDCATVPGQATPSCVPTVIQQQTIAGHIYLCGSNPLTEQPGGTLSASGPQAIPTVSNPLAAVSVPAGNYTMSATAPAGYVFTACGGTATIGNPATTATETVTVPAGKSGVGLFYVTPKVVPAQTLAGHIYLCGSNPLTEQPGGSLSATGPEAVPGAPNPLAPVSVLAGNYTMTANAPAGYVFTACGGSATIGNPATTATESVNVPAGGAGVGKFYVTPALIPTQTLEGHIYLCGSNPLTEQPGGSLSATGPQTVPVTTNPLAPISVLSGNYTMSASAPAGYVFTACGGSATIGNPATTATELVNVPSGGTGVGKFYVNPVIPPNQTLTGHIYLCGSNPLTEQPGGSLSAAGPQAVPATPNPLGPSPVLAGTYTMSASAPTGYVFTACGGSATIGTPATTATEPVTVPAGGSGVGKFYVTPVTTPTQTIVGHIYLCNGSTATTTEQPGGSLAATGPQSVPSGSNPLGPVSVLAGSYTMSATAPAGYVFTSACGGVATIGTPATTANEPVTVPVGSTGVGTFYVTPVTQTIVGHIYLCDGTTETATEVPGGTLATTSGPQLISATPNPLSQQVPAGTYTLTGTAPTGYHFTDCTSSFTGTPTTANQTVIVPSGGTGTGTFYVSPNSPAVALTVAKTNDANGSGTYSQTETATGPGENVPFRVVITNISSVPVDITSLTDIWPGHSLVSALCAGTVIGQTLQPGDSATCDFTVSGYAPANGNSLTNTVSVTGCQTASTTNCQTVPATSTVITPASTSPGTTPPTTPTATPSAPVATSPGGLAFTGVPSRLQLLLEIGFGLLSAGMFMLWLTRPRRAGAA